MKKILIMTMILVLGLTINVFAHPPGNIEMNFNSSNQMIEVSISHSSKNNSEHFVNEVEIYLNGNLQIEQNFIMQTNAKSQYLHYMLPGAKSGDTIKLVAKCNKYGDLENELKVD
ncbi:MAG: hypothetical protein ACQER0_03150 [Bacillota bacterium]